MNDKLKRIVDKLAEKELKKVETIKEYKGKEKTKALTTTERLMRIEKILGIEE